MKKTSNPLILGTWSFSAVGSREAWSALENGGASLDAVCTAARVAEACSEVDSVGFGGLPDATGRVTLDACVMLSPSKCGAVCAVAEHLHVADLARMVMERTNHVMLAGAGADAFAAANGMESRKLLSDDALAAWQRWKGGGSLANHEDRGIDSGKLYLAEGEIHVPHDTIGVLAIDTRGVMAGACSTSGMPFKIPGRVGDSPIPGHGLYIDPEFGGAVATGNGELVMGVCGSFLAVECMRRGATPAQAIREVLQRIEHQCKPTADQQVALIALTPDGQWSAGALRAGFVSSVADSAGVRTVVCDAVLHHPKETQS